jgi:hypothetical protein
MSKTKVTERDTKAAILAAYQELNEELKVLKTDATPRQVRVQPCADACNSPNLDSIDSVFCDLERLRGSFGGTASTLQSKLTVEAERLATLRNQVEVQLSQLKTLHQITPSKDTLSQLIGTYNETAEAFREEMLQKEQELTLALEEQRAEWRKEKEVHQLRVQERDLAVATKHKRDEEEYNYNLKHQRDLDADKYAQEQKALAAALDTLRAEHNKQWTEREEELAAREAHYQTLKERVSGFDERLDKAMRSAKEEGHAIANKQAKNAADLLSRENGGIIKVKELRIQSLKDTLHKQEAEIATLASKLSEAQRRAQELAVKAIEGASNESSFVAIKEIALEQAKAQPKR